MRWRLRIPEASLPLLAAPAAPHGTRAGRLAAMVPRGRCSGCDGSCVKRDGWGGGARGHESEADEAVQHGREVKDDAMKVSSSLNYEARIERLGVCRPDPVGPSADTSWER